jgi:ferredoxin-NADP reductase
MQPTTTAPTGTRERLRWEVGTVTGLVSENASTRSITVELPDWPGHLAGQHVDIRLTDEEGYQAQRSYSLASAPGDRHAVLTVERLDDGEVSPYLVDELRVGDQLELRGPVGGYFVWDPADDDPTLLIAGGSGVVPFRSMLREHAGTGSWAPMRLLYSARTRDRLIYQDELRGLAGRDGIDVHITLTRERSTDRTVGHGRIDRPLLASSGLPADVDPLVYVCGPTAFVEAVADSLTALGHRPERIRTERFGGAGT